MVRSSPTPGVIAPGATVDASADARTSDATPIVKTTVTLLMGVSSLTLRFASACMTRNPGTWFHLLRKFVSYIP